MVYNWKTTEVWYLLLLHHSQTPLTDSDFFEIVWYLLLLHHSQTAKDGKTVFERFVPSAFTSFSNTTGEGTDSDAVWYLLLLHHSQTGFSLFHLVPMFGIFCFYIILKPPRTVRPFLRKFGTFCFYIILKLLHLCFRKVFWFGTFCFYIILKLSPIPGTVNSSLVPSAFTSFSNREEVCQLDLVSLISSAFTSFSNNGTKQSVSLPVWYLLLLHHSQTWMRN